MNLKRSFLTFSLCVIATASSAMAESTGNVSLPRIIELADGIICHEGSNQADVVFDIGFIVTCFYPNTDVLSTYKKYRLEYKNDDILKLLKEDISQGQNARTEIAADFVFDYRWKSATELEIEIFQPGGVTTLEFLQRMSGTTVKSTSSPD